jgi:SNF2 family DNA or RNA helicase
MSAIQRSETIETFKTGTGNILLLTYIIGAEGLNLQCSNTVLLADFEWNDGKTRQSIGRVLRYGQTSKVVNIYYFTSNTGVEKAIFTKHDEKLVILDEMSVGAIKSKIKKLSVKELINIINKEDNIDAINKINNRHTTK